MKPLNSDEIRGNWATLLLPIEADDSINLEKLSEEIDLLINMKVSGIYSNGTAGEFYNLTETEFDQVSELLADKCNAAGMPFQIGCSHMSPQISLERVRRVAALRPGAIQVILPDWTPPNQTEIVSFLQKMAAAAAPVGLVLYNPPHAKKVLSPEDFFLIRSSGINLAGCKVAGGDEAWYSAMKRLVPELSLFVPGHTLATGIRRGAHGAYSNVACLHPQVAQQWYETILTDFDTAKELEGRLQQFIQAHIFPLILELGYSNQAVDKLLAAVGGWAPVGTRLRWPYQGVDRDIVDRVKQAARKTLPEFL